MNLEFIKPQNLDSFLMKSSQSNFNLRLPDCYWVRSYLITTVNKAVPFPSFQMMYHSFYFPVIDLLDGQEHSEDLQNSNSNSNFSNGLRKLSGKTSTQ